MSEQLTTYAFWLAIVGFLIPCRLIYRNGKRRGYREMYSMLLFPDDERYADAEDYVDEHMLAYYHPKCQSCEKVQPVNACIPLVICRGCFRAASQVNGPIEE